MKPDYGIDAPTLVRNFILIGFGLLLVGFLVPPMIGPAWSMGATFLLVGLVMIWGSKIGKFGVRDQVLRDLRLGGDETVLDVGCGGGLILVGAAKLLPNGTATGIDIWQQVDQSNNAKDRTMRNAEAEGVGARVEVINADAREMPFEEGRFDVVLSSYAIHNIPDPEGRAKAIGEIVRVLKPGGRIALVDIQAAGEYVAELTKLGMDEVKRSSPSFIFVIPSWTVTATKPAA